MRIGTRDIVGDWDTMIVLHTFPCLIFNECGPLAVNHAFRVPERRGLLGEARHLPPRHPLSFRSHVCLNPISPQVCISPLFHLFRNRRHIFRPQPTLLATVWKLASSRSQCPIPSRGEANRMLKNPMWSMDRAGDPMDLRPRVSEAC